jgi:sterol desaturase/sphingolipid hydroxylase (fatty acid hydroxylase superfamily)
MDGLTDAVAARLPTTTLGVLEALSLMLSGLLVVLLPIELWRSYRKRRLTRQYWLETLANSYPLLPTLLTQGTFTVALTWLFQRFSFAAPYALPVNVWTALGAIVAVDFMYYWEHRAGHRIRIVWALSHSVHHSSPIYNQTTGLRVSFTDAFFSPWFYLPIVLLGFDPRLVFAAFGLVIGYQQWIHTESIGKLPWFDGWLNAPSNHRAHHGSQPEYLDKNYGGIFIVWDRLFGTYAAENAPVVYGLTQPIASVNPWNVHCAELTKLVREFRLLKTSRARAALLFTAPGTEVRDREPVRL